MLFQVQIVSVLAMLSLVLSDSFGQGQSLEESLKSIPGQVLAAEAAQAGDAVRGAIVFHQQQMQCSKCHTVGQTDLLLAGPNLTAIGLQESDAALVESVLMPSKVIRKGFETTTILMKDGKTVAGLLTERTDQYVILKDPARFGESVRIPIEEIDEIVASEVSLMPVGQVNQLSSRQQFLDLIRYLMEIRNGGAKRARELQPSPALLTFQIPEYEQTIDHAGFLRGLDQESFKRGEAIYQRVCRNCHGTKDEPGSLPTSLRFAEGKFRSGHDPFTMYQTLTRGFGLMAAQTWMVPSQKYDVIHYIRETFLRPHNPSQWSEMTEVYLANLPQGDSRGPEPGNIQPWSAMDYGPALTHSYEIPGGPLNIAQKGMAIRLDPGAGGVSRGQHWMIFDTDTLRMAAAWSSPEKQDSERNFIDWRGIQFNGEHQIHPRISGTVTAENSNGPGWADPRTGSLTDDQRVEGRDGRRYGPLPRTWGRFRGQYLYQNKVILAYDVGGAEILEMPGVLGESAENSHAVFTRTLNIGPRRQELLLQVCEQKGAGLITGQNPAARTAGDRSVLFGRHAEADEAAGAAAPLRFDGSTFVELSDASGLDMTRQDFTITARLKTTANGTIFSRSGAGEKWMPDGQTFFVSDGHLGFDIGWVGAVKSGRKVNDDKWHTVAVTWDHVERKVQLWIDGQLDGSGVLSAGARPENAVARIGFTRQDFPQPETFFTGNLQNVRFFQRALTNQRLRDEETLAEASEGLRGHWVFAGAAGESIIDASGNQKPARIRRGKATAPIDVPIAAGISPDVSDLDWVVKEDQLCLRIPAGSESLRFTLWMAAHPNSQEPAPDPAIPDAGADLKALTQGGPARWPQKLVTRIAPMSDQGAFASDLLTAPETNPWLAQTRFTGLDFFADGRMAACTWDGDVWVISGVPDGPELQWQRIVSGLYQPLGLKILNDTIYLTCRDQLAVLRDLNGDGETDFVECLNNDHQVTEHFHEFAMGLQADESGNFYYAKSGRHALEAVVPHHGTLLRVSPDGTRTDIVATGFRAANGVCLNPDGSFVVTDQEGFWNPKNRINWVTPGAQGKPGFYGNMFGYHDVTDSSDSAMEPPLCWITNEFDRSPGELLWVNSHKWGPLNGSLLNLSYGYGKVFLVPHESVGGQMQGGMIELPIPAFPAGIMRGRFHPKDGQLYLCGMFAWAGSATHPGGIYRLRTTGKEMHLPVQLHAEKQGISLGFTAPIDISSVTPENFEIKVWDLKRTAGYGSQHFNERPLEVSAANVSDDGLHVTVQIPKLGPTWGMEIRYSLKSRSGEPVDGRIHNTIHHFPE